MSNKVVITDRVTGLVDPTQASDGTSKSYVNTVLKNYILNFSAETNTAGWATYSDSAGVSPVDGTGGSPASTWTRSTSVPLGGVASFLLTKSAANRQGEGASYDFTLDRADFGKVLTVSMDMAVDSGTFVAGTSTASSDVTVWLYDVTNATIIQPSNFKFFGNHATISERYSGQFQTSANSTSYRLIIHIGSTSALAYTLKIDDVKVTQSQYIYGSPMTDEVAYTPTFTGFGTCTNINFYSHRDGQHLVIRGYFNAGASPTAVEARISLGYNGGNSNVTSVSTLPVVQACGELDRASATTNQYGVLIEASKTYMVFDNQGSAAGLTKVLGNAIVGGSEAFSLYARIPITGWSSSVQMSDSADTRIVAARISGAPTTGTISAGIGSSTTAGFPTVDYDTHGAYSLGTYTVPVAGVYKIHAQALLSGTFASGQYLEGAVYKNGTLALDNLQGRASSTNTPYPWIDGTLSLVAGDLITTRFASQGTSPSFSGGDSTTSYLTIERLVGPSAIAATETVAALYYGAPTGTLNSSYNKVTLPTKRRDSHSAYSSGTYTVPAAGTYSISAQLAINGTSVSGAGNYCGIYINGALFIANKVLDITAGSSNFVNPNPSFQGVDLKAGDTVEVYSLSERTGPAFSAGATASFFSIARTSL